MAWEIENFWNKANTNWFKQNPQNAWRPKKWVSLVNQQLKEMWYDPATKADIEETYMQMINLTMKELKELWEWKDQPALVRVLAKNIVWGKWFEVIEKMLDRGIWKAVQKSELIAKQHIIMSEEENELVKDLININNES